MNELTTIRDDIENMEKIHQLNILQIFNRNDIEYTENSNGIFINMTILDQKIIAEIITYMKYVKLQEMQLDKVEAMKDRYKEEFYKDNKAEPTYTQ